MNKIVKTFKFFSAAAIAAFFSVGTAFAQDNAEVSDEKLEAYVMVMDSVDILRAQIQEEISTMIMENELMNGGKAYNEIKTAGGDTVKLTEQGITPEQIAAFNEIENAMAEKSAALNSKFSEMVKEHVGIADYKAIKSGLSNDEGLKERYEAILAEKEEGETGAAEEAEGAGTTPSGENTETAAGANGTEK